MKTNQIVILAALGLGACSAQASWNITGNNPIYTPVGSSGSEVFTIQGSSYLDAGTYKLGPVTTTPLTLPSLADVYGVVSSSSVDLVDVYFPSPPFPANDKLSGTFAAADFTVTVSWFVPLGTQPKSYDISVDLGYSGGPSGNGTDEVGNVIVVVPAPEPTQTLAGAMILGCGGLLFAGRRLFKKATV